jgi:hypothetical protein
MGNSRIQLTALWGNDDAESSILVSRRRWTAIQSGAEHTVDASSSYEGKRHKVVLAIRQPTGVDRWRRWHGVRGGSSCQTVDCDRPGLLTVAGL